MIFSSVLSPILDPLLTATGPFWTLLTVSVFVSFLSTIVYKYTTDQARLRRLKAEMKKFQKKIRKLQKEDPAKALQMQKKVLKTNGEYMKLSFKATLYTFLPLILFFGWLGASLALAPLGVGDEFSVEVSSSDYLNENVTLTLPQGISLLENQSLTKDISSASWSVRAMESGEFMFSWVTTRDDTITLPVIVSSSHQKVVPLNQTEVLQAQINEYPRLLIFDGVFFFKDVPWLSSWGWLGAYLLFSLLFSFLTRRLLNVA